MTTFGWSPTEGELQDLIGVIDQDDNGCISFDEFVWLMQQVKTMTTILYVVASGVGKIILNDQHCEINLCI